MVQNQKENAKKRVKSAWRETDATEKSGCCKNSFKITVQMHLQVFSITPDYLIYK